jgi:hypothetical protein
VDYSQTDHHSDYAVTSTPVVAALVVALVVADQRSLSRARCKTNGMAYEYPRRYVIINLNQLEYAP